jgi:hypothetical protein
LQSGAVASASSIASVAEVTKAARNNDPEKLVSHLRDIQVPVDPPEEEGYWLCQEYDLAKTCGHEQIKKILAIYKAASVAISLERFNETVHFKLKAHMCGVQKSFSLLHAAVVFGSPDLALKLISQGADPNANSDVGSPIAFASGMADLEKERLNLYNKKEKAKVKAKVGNRESKTEDSETAALEEKCKALDNVAKLLQKIGAKKRGEVSHLSLTCGKRKVSGMTDCINGPLAKRAGIAAASPAPSPAPADSCISPSDSAENVISHNEVQFLLESGSKTDDGWSEGGQVASKFYAKLGQIDKEKFKEARELAVRSGLMEWGRRDLLDTDRPIIPVTFGRTEGVSSESYLRLTHLGRSRLCKFSAQNLNSPPEAGAFHSQMDIFLQSMRPDNDKDHREWLSMGPLLQSFLAKNSNMSETRFMELRGIATHENLISWGRTNPMHMNDAIPAVKEQFSGMALQAFLRLTPRGRQAAADGYQGKETGRPQQVQDFQASDLDVALPVVQETWYVVQGQSRCTPCKFFNRSAISRCMHGSACRYPHVEPRLGKNLREYASVVPHKFPREHVAFTTHPDVRGRPWVTACFRCPVTKIYYRAEGGWTGRRNQQGIWWYPAESEAHKAVEFVYAASSFNTGGPLPGFHKRASATGTEIKGYYCP